MKNVDWKKVWLKVWPHWLVLGGVAVVDLMCKTRMGNLGSLFCVVSMGLVLWMTVRHVAVMERMKEEHARVMAEIDKIMRGNYFRGDDGRIK